MIFTLPNMPTFAPGLVHTPCGQSPLSDASRRKHQSQQPRQLLSCTKCRERKVKCDRTKPCSACCARGAPKECHFVAESGDYAPIQQSYELRKLRAENVRLKERLRASRISIEDEGSDQSLDSQIGERSASSSQRRRATRQRRFQGSEWSDSIYFGSPGLARVINDVSQVWILRPRRLPSPVCCGKSDTYIGGVTYASSPSGAGHVHAQGAASPSVCNNIQSHAGGMHT
jgi:hypothetical protein